ncbi:MAG: nitronate monooxygenase, partial [Alphaproteobacteria bacterium]|nr:nitronate monooxygenase [Alphaproteobacteria bacterium]
MPIETEITDRLGVRYPILLAPMDLVAGARLTAAVGLAGGFGILGGGYGDRSWLERELKLLTELLAGTRSPFGVGFITWSLAKRPQLLDVALEAGPQAIMLSFGDPKPFAGRIKSAGAQLICQVQNEDTANEALEAGADVLVAQGTEAGGHGGSRTTLDIVCAVVDLA